MADSGRLTQLLTRAKRIDPLFALTVLLPTLLATLYFGILAADIYVSTSTFVVRSSKSDNRSAGMLGAFLQGSGLARAEDDTYAVNDYVLSRDALAALDTDNAFRNSYGAGHGDFLSRFGTFGLLTTFEDLMKYFKRRVEVRYDTTTAITTLTVEAFTAKDAQRFNQQLLRLGERRVNEMNSRALQDTVRYAQAEVTLAEEKIRTASGALQAFRNHQTVFDPEKQSALQLQQVAQLQGDLTESLALLAQLQSVAPVNPRIPVLKTRIATLRSQIEETTKGVTGGRGSLATKSTSYEQLALDRELAERQLASARTSLESARSDALRQQLYLERVSQPNAPDKALLPYRVRNIAATFILGLILWGALRLLIASVREHRD